MATESKTYSSPWSTPAPPSTIHWITCVHPQGWIYFFNPKLNVVTEEDIRIPLIERKIIDNHYQCPALDVEDAHLEFHLTGNSTSSSEGVSHFRLAVNHAHCIASYNLDEVKSANVSLLLPAALNRRRRLYWNYLWNHPAHVKTPGRALSDAADALTWFYTDNLIYGAKSVAPFSKVECDDLSRVVQDLSQPCYNNSVAKTVFLSWLLREVCSFRNAESFGEHTLKTSQQLRVSKATRSSSSSPSPYMLPILNIITGVLFFGIPWTYLQHVKYSSEFRGRLSNVKRNWEEYTQRLVREYSDFLLISTVLLSATVGFLSVSDIGSVARVTAIISAFTSLGSIIIGVFSIWRHQASTRTRDWFTYMHNAQHNYLGVHGHALLLSLPPVLLMWAIAAFTISILAYTLQSISDTYLVNRVSAWIIVGVFMLILICVTAALYSFSVMWKFRSRQSWLLRYFTSP